MHIFDHTLYIPIMTGIVGAIFHLKHKGFFIIPDMFLRPQIAESADAAEYTDCNFAEGLDSLNECPNLWH